MTSYYRPPGQSTARSTALTSWGSGALLTTWPGPSIYGFTGTGLSALPLSLPSYQTVGFTAAATDPSGNAWVIGYFGGVFEITPNGLVTSYQLPDGYFTGVAFCQGYPYFLQSTGALYTISQGVVALVAGGFGQHAVGLSTDGVKLYTVLPNSQKMGVFTFSNYLVGVATTVSTPMGVPASAIASAAGVAVAGRTNAVLASGATSLAVAPNGTYAGAVNTAGNRVMLLGGPDPNWQILSSVTGQGAPADVAWASSGEQIIVTDTKSAVVSIYNLVNNAFTFSANIATVGASHVEVTPDGLTALVTRSTANAVRVLSSTANVWSTKSDVVVSGSPGVLAVISNTEAVAGTTGGLVWLAQNNGSWGIETQVALPFAVSGIALDLAGQVYAVGTGSAYGQNTGFLYSVTKSGITATTSWSGRADAVFWEQGQVAVLDTDYRGSGSSVFAIDGGVLQVADTTFPTSPTGLASGAIWSNAGMVSVVPGVTPNPAAPAVYYSAITPAQLLTLGGGNLPLTPPLSGTGQLWNNGGEVAVS